METTRIDNTNDLSDNEWITLLYLLFIDDEKKQNGVWNQFERDLLYKNRFSSNSPVIEELHACADRARKVIPHDSIFYRARIYHHNGYDAQLRYYLKANGRSKEEIDDLLNNLSDSEKQLALLSQYSGPVKLSNEKEAGRIVDIHQKWKKNVRFKGYSAIESTAPKSSLVKDGRANPDHIRYLYLCEDDITPIYEVRPIIDDQVSVAKFRLLKDITVYDLALNIQDQVLNTDNQRSSLYDVIGKMFSKPLNGDAQHYLPTQFLAEEIKRMGFDGLRFNSSLHKDGINVVLFDPDTCKAVSSELRMVNGIKLDISDHPIYQIGQEPVAKEENLSFDSNQKQQ